MERFINPFSNRMLQSVDLASMTPEERDRYDESIKIYRDYVNTITDTSHREWKKGQTEGRKKEKIEIARNMKAESMPLKVIAKVTGLSPEEIERL
ncbi:MAG TPA: hypothetical protein DDZ96_09800 [Porphyromonadaceae bacterium]|jgi:predicted transposase/invertase (TIGR01784 family)|nr:hypothetical protein [Porphyromonadaceae bacterium]